MQGSPATTRLRKVACLDCGNVARQSRSCLSRGLLVCPCGGKMIPAALEDAWAALDAAHVTAADLERHPEYAQFERERLSVAVGQAPLDANPRHLKNPLRSPDAVALERVEAARLLAAHDARHAALAAHAFGGEKTPDQMPF